MTCERRISSLHTYLSSLPLRCYPTPREETPLTRHLSGTKRIDRPWHLTFGSETMSPTQLWQRYQKYLVTVPSLNVSLDVSRMHFDEAFLSQMEPKMQKAFAAMDALEKGAIANPDENRMVGHYWLRAADMAPTKEIAKEIKDTLADIKSFAADVHSGKIN